MDGRRRTVESADGTPLALLTEGHGPPLLLVHGGTADLTRWAPVWEALTAVRTVTAMDRRGRGDSGDGRSYSLEHEADDVRAVAELLADESERPASVVGHSYGAVCTLLAAAGGAPFDRVVLYEPPSGDAVPPEVFERLASLLDDGRDDEALVFFLQDVVGRTPEDVEALRSTPMWVRRRAAVGTMRREGAALQQTDLVGPASRVQLPVLMLLGGASPPWARATTEPVLSALPDGRLVTLQGQGHMAIDQAPELFVREVLAFLDG